MQLLLFVIALLFPPAAARFQRPVQRPDNIQLRIALAKQSFAPGEAIPIKITLTNRSVQTVRLWFDSPPLSTGGPPHTSVDLRDARTGKSVLRYVNKAVLSSQLYTTEQAASFEKPLKPGSSISRTYTLETLAVLSASDGRLRKGSYRLQVAYSEYPWSNALSFSVR